MKKSGISKVLVVTIPAVAAIVTALITMKGNQDVPRPRQEPIVIAGPATKALVFSGSVKDEEGLGIKFANIQIVGRPEFYTTESNGNFQIEIPTDDSVLMKDCKVVIDHPQFQQLYQRITLPSEGLVIVLKKK